MFPAIAFYRDLLGLRFLFQAGQLGFLECGGVRLMLSAPEQPAFAHPSSILYFKVNDIRSSHRALEQRGVRFTSDPHAVAKLPITSCGWPSSRTARTTSSPS
jgi:methylmalonyl-CoA/ethylmalonyl-CoA epimerase